VNKHQNARVGRQMACGRQCL